MQPLGVLLIHGFTSSLDTVNGLIPCLERDRLPYRVPVLRGHGSKPEALRGVGAQDWYVDARAALFDLLKECEQAVVVGLSMGGLVALQLAIDHPEHVAGVVSVAAAMRFKSPLAKWTPLLGKFTKYWPSPKPPKGATYHCTNYPYFAIDSFASLLRYGQEIEGRLHEVKVPILVLGTKMDNVVDPKAAQLIFDGVSSTDKELRWFTRSGHEMMQDCEHEAVFAAIEEFALKRRNGLGLPK